MSAQDEMMELIWTKEHDAANKVRRAVDGLRNATDMDTAFYRFYEITNYSQILLKLIYEDISTGYWEEDDDTK